MVEPITKEEYVARRKRTPPNLFSHNDQQRCAQNVHAQAMEANGVIGRMIEKLTTRAEAPYIAESYSVHGNALILEGSHEAPRRLERPRC